MDDEKWKKISVDFNKNWRPDISGNQKIGIELNEKLSVSDRVITSTTMKLGCGAFIVNKNDSYSFQNDTDIVKKARKNETLSLVLKYYAETLNPDQEKIGVHRAIEQIIKYLGKGNDRSGREILAKMAGENEQYVKDLMEGIQERRHSLAWLTFKKCKFLSEQESISRAKKLIEAYANSITL